eukprot:3690386-Rhodomonas_salina.1
MRLSGYDNPTFVTQAGAQTSVLGARRSDPAVINPTFDGASGATAQISVLHGAVHYDDGSGVPEVEGAVLESVMRINGFARKVRRARAQAAVTPLPPS